MVKYDSRAIYFERVKKQQDIYQYLTSIADRNLANRGKAARMVKVKYKTIYGRRW